MSELSWGRAPKHHAGVPVSGGRRVGHYGYIWPCEPETCSAGPTSTVWVRNGQVLLCRGCGLNVT
ncbi:MAG: hypothetical protein WAV90_13035 [Gordonia amarae]